MTHNGWITPFSISYYICFGKYLPCFNDERTLLVSNGYRRKQKLRAKALVTDLLSFITLCFGTSHLTFLCLNLLNYKTEVRMSTHPIGLM